MKKLAMFIVLGLFYLLASSPASAGNVEKAADFVKAGMYKQAIAVLEKEILENPTSPRAHLELGNAYAATERYQEAEERYKSAVSLSANYGNKVGQIYRKMGDESLKNGRLNSAKMLYGRYLSYYPGEREALAATIFDAAWQEVLLKNYPASFELHTLASNINPELRQSISETYLKIADNLPDNDCILFYRYALDFTSNQQIKQRVGNRLLAIGSKIAKIPGRNEAQLKLVRVLVAQCLGEQKAEDDLGEIWYAPVGQFDASGKAGERTPFLIKGAQKSFFNFGADNFKFKVVYEDGEIIRLWVKEDIDKANADRTSSRAFYLEFIEDCKVTLFVKKWD